MSAGLSAQAVPARTWVSPVPGGRALAEIMIEQAMLSVRLGALGEQLSLRGTLNLEGLTMPEGVLTLGAWGEGFNERRHPHTYVHELILSANVGRTGTTRASITAGKGFVPFGTDDPMNRPAVRFPVNHHWSQILERALLAAGVQAGAVRIEAALFNGDEPERPDQWPRIAGRFGDSWALRVSVAPVPGIEAQISRAQVKSPEHRPGAGTSHEKWSISGRLEQPLGTGTFYALGEWAHTDEGSEFLRFDSWLVEASWMSTRSRPYYRLELTDRPEEERSLDPFRSARPHLENTILGVTHWTVHTVGYGVTLPIRSVHLEPLLEVGYATIKETGGGLFNVEDLFGGTSLWSVTAGVMVRWPGPPHRMGRYGVAEEDVHRH